MHRTKFVRLAALVLSVAVWPLGAEATPKLLKEAKDSGMAAQNCQYCHVSKLPKKEGFKSDDLNERGRWMLGEKEKQKAKDVKGEWLKSYPGGKDQK